MKTIDNLDVRGRRVLVRLDLNVPLENGHITDDSRIRAALPTLNALVARGAAVIVCANLGRPGGTSDPRLSLRPVADHLGELLGRQVGFAADTVGLAARVSVVGLRPRDVIMLENVRFDARETSKDDVVRGSFADELAALADLYVDDAFGAAHRKHASVYDVALRLPHAAGYLLRAEVAALGRLTEEFQRPYVVVLGGAKVQDKIGALSRLTGLADRILIGGAMAFPFLVAQGHLVGTSSLDPGDVGVANACLDTAARAGVPVELPSDLVVASSTGAAAHRVVDADAVPAGEMALDIGRARPSPSRPRSPRPRRCSGTARWACSSWPTTPTVRAPSSRH
jgi:phosphoglycerate kinase